MGWIAQDRFMNKWMKYGTQQKKDSFCNKGLWGLHEKIYSKHEADCGIR
jgi:hypothetical protein